MAGAAPLKVGRDAQSRFVAYGDECKFRNTAVYAFALVPRTRVTRVERKLSELKQRLGIAAETTLHCHVLGDPHKREKAGLEHLSYETLQAVVASAITMLRNALEITSRYAPFLERML